MGGWQVRRQGAASDWDGGPYSWEQLVAFAREGRIVATDHVWRPPMPEWILAGAVSGLIPQPMPAAPLPVAAAPAPGAPVAATPAPAPASPVPAPAAPVYGTAPPAPASAPARSNRVALIAAAIGVAVLIVGGIGAFALLRGDGPASGGPSVGASAAKVPASASLVKTAAWGEVPANQLGLLMAEGATRADADAAAKTVDGTVVGEVESAGVYQVEFPGTNEADLAAAIAKAQAAAKVEGAFPNEQAYDDTEIWGVRVDPYADPIYDGKAGAGYQAIGVSKAWSYIRGAGIDLNPVKVGVIDTGLYLPGDGAEDEFSGSKVKLEFPDPAAAQAAGPEVYDDGTLNPAGNHGTAVSTMIAGDPDNGGPAGVAGPLRDKLTLSAINKNSGQYGTFRTAPDPSDATKYVASDGRTYALGMLVALSKQVSNDAKVINCSWGNSKSSTATVTAFRRFFTKMAKDHPDVLFVCSGGNGGTVMDGSLRFPSGLKLPNMVTVGWLNKDGTTAKDADRASANYEITLGAPSTDAVVGLDAAGGAVQQDGSSFAAPQVTAAAAILKSLDPRLSAGAIKQILSNTARKGVADSSGKAGAASHLIGAEMGGRILAVDEAVLKVINDLRKAKGLPALTGDVLEKMGVVDAVAVTGKPGEYAVRGIVAATGEKGTDLTIAVFGENSAIGGSTTQRLAGPGELSWSVTLMKDEGTIKVTRLDNGAASLITVQPAALAGTWKYDDYFMGQKTGLTPTFTVVRKGDGYVVTKGFTTHPAVVLEGANVSIRIRANGGSAVYSGILSGDTIKGTMVFGSEDAVPWNVWRVK
jgi:hypothetical protein